MASSLNLSASRVARLRDALTSLSDTTGDPDEVELQRVLTDPTVQAVAINLPLNGATKRCTAQVIRHADQLEQWVQLASI